MIDEIQIENLALIKEGTLIPARGLTAITGETGAGKTALLSSCKLLMGSRAERELIREGENEASVQGRFFFDEPVFANVVDPEAQDDPSLLSDIETVVSRSFSADGRSRVRINGSMVSLGQLSNAISGRIDLCSQHDQQGLLKASMHRALLDSWISDALQDRMREYRQAYLAAESARAKLDEIKLSRQTSDAKIEDMRYALREIEALGPIEGEYEDLVKLLEKSENAEALVSSAECAYSAISDDERILDLLNSAIASLEAASRYDGSLQDHIGSLREAGFILEDVSRDLALYKQDIEFDPETLVANQERVAQYQSVLRKYGPDIEDVLAKADEAKDAIALIDNADEVERQAQVALDEAEAALAAAAMGLSDLRASYAPTFASEVSSIMSKLEMGSADLVCEVTLLDRKQWNIEGPNKVELLFRPSDGMQARPLSRIASGGELSRVMLAIHVVMGEKDKVSTLIFDEIDAGVGGATALALAEVLGMLAHTHQVIVVTHLAQVAAKAEKQYIVSKHEENGMAQTRIEEVRGSAREEELARMLSGSITDTSIAHAKELIRGSKAA